MVSSSAATVKDYLASLPEDRRKALSKIRTVIRKNLHKGFKEGMQWGMIGYYIPLSRYPDTYNGQPLSLVGLASQKQHMSVYLMNVYGDPDLQAWFTDAWTATGRKLNMGKSCVRFKKIEDVALDVIGEAVARTTVEGYLEQYEAARSQTKTAKKKTAKKKTAKKKTAKKKTAKKKTAKR